MLGANHDDRESSRLSFREQALSQRTGRTAGAPEFVPR
jgi:hypothetical protein